MSQPNAKGRGAFIAIIVLVVLLAAGVAHLTGLVSIGDPFVGEWKPTNGDPNAATLVVRHTDAGYLVRYATGELSATWMHATRSRNTLTIDGSGGGTDPLQAAAASRYVFQPWSRHLVAGAIVLHKVS